MAVSSVTTNSKQMREIEVFHLSGMAGLGGSFLIALAALGCWAASTPVSMVIMGVLVAAFFVYNSGFVINQPQEAKVVQFFGHYVGTLRATGLCWALPLTTKDRMSVRLRNFECPRLKVNEAEGNPIEIAAIIVWKVVDTSQASFNVESLETFLEKQTESALRMLATKHPYDRHTKGDVSLHENIDEINEQLKLQVSLSLSGTGIEIIEARISHLAYAPEIAAAMLQRQQAQAIIAAREKIVEGAVGMVEMALTQLQKNGIVQLDEERKAAMVSNLLVVLCSERPSQPIVNTGSIY